MNCPHKILGVSKSATLNEIKLAYRRLALQLHPDTNGGDAKKSEQFKLVASAYEILSNPESRKKWEFEQKYGNTWNDMSSHTTSYPFRGRNGHPSGGIHFNEDEWNAFHYGIDIDEFDFNSPDEFIIDMSTGKVKRSSRKQKTSKKNRSSSSNNQNNNNAFHEFSQEEVEEILRHATRGPKYTQSKNSYQSNRDQTQQKRNGNASKSSTQNNQSKKTSRRSNRKDSNDCIIS